MEEIIFYPENKKSGPLKKLLGFLLLSAGASSVLDVEYIRISDKIYYKNFMESEKAITFDDAEILYSENNPVVISGPDDNFSIRKFSNPDKIVDFINSQKS